MRMVRPAGMTLRTPAAISRKAICPATTPGGQHGHGHNVFHLNPQYRSVASRRCGAPGRGPAFLAGGRLLEGTGRPDPIGDLLDPSGVHRHVADLAVEPHAVSANRGWGRLISF